MSQKTMFSNSFETSDNNDVEYLTTHYYNDNYEATKYALVNVGKELGYEIENINDDYCEILMTGKRGEIVCTLSKISYTVTGVDFKITTTYVIPFGRTAKELKKVYDALNHKVSLKAIGGHHLG